MKETRCQVYPCNVNTCAKRGKVPLCSGELHLCHDHFDHWVAFLRENPLLVEKWSTENFAAWDKHFNSFVSQEMKLQRHLH